MGMSTYIWYVIGSDEKIRIVESETIQDVADELDECQPIAIIRGDSAWDRHFTIKGASNE